MSKPRFIQSTIALILIAQFVVVIIASIALLGLGLALAFSVFIGGLICILPNAYLAYKLTVRRTADPQKLINTLYTAEISKIIITGALFAVVFATQEWILPGALLGGYGLAQLTHWLTPVFSNLKQK